MGYTEKKAADTLWIDMSDVIMITKNGSPTKHGTFYLVGADYYLYRDGFFYKPTNRLSARATEFNLVDPIIDAVLRVKLNKSQ